VAPWHRTSSRQPQREPATKEMRTMNKTWVMAALVVTLCPLAASAQEYAIKVKRPGLGDKSQVKLADMSDIEFKILDNGGNAVQEKKEMKAHKFVFLETGLERAPAGDDLVRLKRHYEHGERKIDGTRETLPYQGKTLLIEKKDGKFQFQTEGAAGEIIEGKEADELNEEFNKGDFRKLINDHFLPRKAVKVDETWKLDVAPLAKDFSKDGKIEIDQNKSKGTGKLVKAYQKNGKQFGVIELVIEFPVTHLINDGNKSPTKEGKITIKVARDGCIDGNLEESRLTVSFDGDIRADINANGMDLSVVITVRATAEEVRAPVTK
jgi:hypothetical protein